MCNLVLGVLSERRNDSVHGVFQRWGESMCTETKVVIQLHAPSTWLRKVIQFLWCHPAPRL
ncbi:hypothetical protein M404DRAFT_193261 [Pisolithus tinctorius Marx 270]|uniref:Uncharacterized protein n=1 Tax=Pisolithus tinctorius Marx 270 TaxID=870435 RepID=A0A0C3PKZ9_PISTI|nr:hypothetical protein M404DRAFT_193261 [Pisolithus tinctorius Marx 270]